VTASRGLVWSAHVAVALALFGLQFVLPPFHHGMVARIMVLATYAVGYNLLLGYTGLMSLGHAMFFAAGLYGGGLSVYYLGFGPIAALAAGLAASLLVALVIGGLSLRTTGVAFLIVTMLFAQVFFLTTLHFNTITGGDQGLVLTGRLQPIALGGARVALSLPAAKYNLAWLIFSGALLVSLWMVRSPIGRVWIGIRENEERTRMLGYDPFAYKMLAVLASAAISGLAGATYALLFSYVGSTFASVLYSIYPLLWSLLGGVGTIVGPLVGTGLMTYLIDVASGITSSYLFVVGIALVVVIIRFPRGIVGGARARWWPWLP
jgi:branched-chain amino acid transport system permease protein